MPMDKTSTHYSPTSLRSGKADRAATMAVVTPSAKSIAFIRQFARCYHMDTRLAPTFAGMILN